MKKLVLSIAVVSAFSFASCKKDHTCTCIDSTAGSIATVDVYPKSSKAAARANCLSYTQTYSGVTVTTTCTLK